MTLTSTPNLRLPPGGAEGPLGCVPVCPRLRIGRHAEAEADTVQTQFSALGRWNFRSRSVEEDTVAVVVVGGAISAVFLHRQVPVRALNLKFTGLTQNLGQL